MDRQVADEVLRLHALQQGWRGGGGCRWEAGGWVGVKGAGCFTLCREVLLGGDVP